MGLASYAVIRYHAFERGPDRTMKKMAAAGRSIWRLPVISNGYIANRAQHLALLLNFDLLVCLFLEIKPADGGFLKRAYRGKRSCCYVGFIRKLGQRGKNFLVAFQDGDAGLPARVVRNDFVLHDRVTQRCAASAGLP